MTPRKLYNFYIDPELADGLKALKERTGAPEAESNQAGTVGVSEKHGAMPKTERPRATTRKRS